MGKERTISLEPMQAYSSIFTYLPSDTPNYSFLGFSRYEKEDLITQESWREINDLVKEKVFNVIKQKFTICNCPTDFIESTLKKFAKESEAPVISPSFPNPQELCRKDNFYDFACLCLAPSISLMEDNREVAEIGVVLKKLPAPQDSQQFLRQIEINEFAVKTLCEMSVEVGIEKTHILKQVQQAVEKGFLLKSPP